MGGGSLGIPHTKLDPIARAGRATLWGCVIAVILIGTGAVLFYIHDERAQKIRDLARESDYMPLDLPTPLVYSVDKQLTRRITDDKKPEVLPLEDSYFTRVRLVSDPGGRRARAIRSERCASLKTAVSTISESREETLVRGEASIQLARTGEVLLPLLTPLSPQSFTVTCGSRVSKGMFCGWPLVEEVDLSREETRSFSKMAVETALDQHAIFNPVNGESLFFGQRDSGKIKVGGRELLSIKLQFSGQLSGKQFLHRTEGALWLASGLGVLKEERNVTLKVYPKPVYDEQKGSFRYLSQSVVVFTSHMVKRLVHPIEGR